MRTITPKVATAVPEQSEPISSIDGIKLELHPVESYLVEREMLSAAFKALAEKAPQVDETYKELLREQGSIEIKRLIGQDVDEDEVWSKKPQLSELRDRLDAFEAAKQALMDKQASLNQQLPAINHQLQSVLGKLSAHFHEELERDLREVAAYLHALNCKYHVMMPYTGNYTKTLSDFSRMNLYGPKSGESINIAAVQNRGNYADPVEHWKDNVAAVALHEELAPIRELKKRVERLARNGTSE